MARAPQAPASTPVAAPASTPTSASASTSAPAALPRVGAAAGFDAASAQVPQRLQQHLAQAWSAPVTVSGWRRFPTGMSWVTYGFTAHCAGAAHELILRVGDPAGLFGPYQTEPEFRALTALAAADVRVPPAVLRCDDLSVLGAPFIVLRRVAGDTPTPWNGAASRIESERVTLAHDFADILGALHAFDWRSGPLADWACDLSVANVAQRQVAQWAGIAGLADAPLPPAMHYGYRWLQARAPVADRLVVVHGDYRVGNFLRVGGRITAFLDWELVHLGDGHEDLAWAALRAFSPGSRRVGGLVDRDEFHARYTARSGIGIDPVRLHYYSVLGLFKSAAMLLGAERRIRDGRAHDMRMAAMGFQLAPTLLEMMRVIEEAR